MDNVDVADCLLCKAMDVINSCKTKEQLAVAAEYDRLALKRIAKLNPGELREYLQASLQVIEHKTRGLIGRYEFIYATPWWRTRLF